MKAKNDSKAILTRFKAMLYYAVVQICPYKATESRTRHVLSLDIYGDGGKENRPAVKLGGVCLLLFDCFKVAPDFT